MSDGDHPTPWRVDVFPPSKASFIYDDDGALVETVYGRNCDPNGEALARRIMDAVNREPTDG